MVWHEIFPTHKHVKLHHYLQTFFTTLFDTINAVSKPEHGDQIVYGVLYSAKHLRTSAKFTGKLQILQNSAKTLQSFFHLLLTMHAILIALRKRTQTKLVI